MIIRKARISEARTLSALAKQTYSDAFGYSFAPSDLAAHLEKNLSPNNFERILTEDTVLIAQVDPHIVGYVQFGRATLSNKAAFNNEQAVRRLYVLSDFQNRGIGSQLLETALVHPDMRNAENIYLDVWDKNHGAQRFYARYGFKVIGQREFFVESGAETDLDLVMVRRRSAA